MAGQGAEPDARSHASGPAAGRTAPAGRGSHKPTCAPACRVGVPGCKQVSDFAARHGGLASGLRMLGQDHTEMEKTMITRRSLLSGTAAAGLCMSGLGFAQTQSHAQSYPDRPIKVILPYTAGSPNDM